MTNATGCSSIYSGAISSTPYATNAKSQGPAWSNSLFEDFCEYGLGMAIANKKMRGRIVAMLNELLAKDDTPAEFKAAAEEWIAASESSVMTEPLTTSVTVVSPTHLLL